jgi:hypothetical protein
MEMTDQITDTNTEIEEKPDTYHDPKKLTRFADIAGGLSWFFLVLFVITVGIIGYFAWFFYTNHSAIENFLYNLPTFLVPFFLSLFFWITLKLISEGIYILMDIEDNTRRPKSPSNE